MAFNTEQVGHLTAKLDSSHVKGRKQAGRNVDYIEGWHAIAEANRIFGFDAWDRATVELKCVAEHPRKIGDPQKGPQKDGWGVTYTARVRVTVRTDGVEVMRDGVGAGHGIDVDPGQAHESAIKEAETDAMKRALMTFGNPFGLALYDKSRENVEAPQRQQPARQQADDAPKRDKPNAAFEVMGSGPDDFATRVIALVKDAPDAATIQAIRDANAGGLTRLQKDNKALWDSVMQAMSNRTTDVMEKAA